MLGSLEALLRYHELAVQEVEGRATPRLYVERARCDLELPTQLIDRYQYLFSRYRASAVTPLKSGCCSGCHVQVARSRQNTVEEGVYACEQCGRFVIDTAKVHDLAYSWTVMGTAQGDNRS